MSEQPTDADVEEAQRKVNYYKGLLERDRRDAEEGKKESARWCAVGTLALGGILAICDYTGFVRHANYAAVPVLGLLAYGILWWFWNSGKNTYAEQVKEKEQHLRVLSFVNETLRKSGIDPNSPPPNRR